MLAGACTAQEELVVGTFEIGKAAGNASVNALDIDALCSDLFIAKGDGGRFLGDGKAVSGLAADYGNVGLAGFPFRVFIGIYRYLVGLFLSVSLGAFRVKVQPGGIALDVPRFCAGEADGFLTPFSGKLRSRGNPVVNFAGVFRPFFFFRLQFLLFLAGEKQPCHEGEGCKS